MMDGRAGLRITLVVVAYNSGTALTGLVDSAATRRHRVDARVFLHSRHPATVAACAELARRPGITLVDQGGNAGVARSWNDGILAGYAEGADVVVVANDDITFGGGDLDRLAERAARCRDSYIVTCAGPHRFYGRHLPSHGFACFAVNPVAVEVLGCFDENFFPAYCEDQDFARRASLAALTEENCADTHVVHEGSATIFRDRALLIRNQRTHALNQAYYRRKWGGDAGAETLAHPFGVQALGPRIAPERRHAPYGELDRPDLPLVPAGEDAHA